jgi:zinc D-Ala-D-Ala dipeptidase
VQSGFDGKYRIKIWDIYRPRAVQGAIYNKFQTELEEKNPSWDIDRLYLEVGKFVSPPYQTERIPPHVTGGAVDITLTDSDGNDLDM